MNIIVDLSYIMQVYRYALPNLSYNGIFTGGIYGTYNLIKKMKKENPDFIFHICLDSHCKWRRDLLPQYKANRDSENKLDIGLVIDTCRILKTIPDTYFYREPNTEADDLIAILSLNLKDVIILSGDNDMLQLLPLGVRIASRYHKGDFEYKDEEYCKKRFGVSSKALKYYKFLKGDSSDCIKSITNRIPEKEVCKFCEDWANSGFSNALGLASVKLDKQINENIDRLRINIKLIDLSLYNSKKEIPRELVVTEDLYLFDKYGIQR